MISDELRAALQNIVHGTGDQEPGDRISTVRRQLLQSFGPSRTSQEDFEDKAVRKKGQDQFLRDYAQRHGLWLTNLPAENSYLTRGGESKVYFSSDGLHVLKLNNARYYATWTEYFNSLILHNVLFPSTAYFLVGFTDNEDVPAGEPTLSVLLRQPFIEGEQADLAHIQDLLNFNEFKLIKRQDYFNDEFRIRLEDMHDENVISKDGLLFFIDTVFYIME
jgi:hypothetical protein